MYNLENPKISLPEPRIQLSDYSAEDHNITKRHMDKPCQQHISRSEMKRVTCSGTFLSIYKRKKFLDILQLKSNYQL